MDVVQSLGGGWVWFTGRDDSREGDAYLRFALTDDGRLSPIRAHVVEGDGPLIRELRALPLNDMEAAVNGPDMRDHVVEHLDDDVDFILSAQKDQSTGKPKRRQRKPTGKLPIPEGRKRPDSFYRRAADEYTRLVAGGDRAPAQTIAAANDVPATTAHRWIKEARRRGFLPAGRPGRAG
jgi:hypothetical protein